MLNEIISGSKYVVSNAKDVKINYDNIDILITEISNFEHKHYLTLNPFNILELDTEELVNLLLIYASICFSFWGEPRWTVEYEGELLDGSKALLYSLLKVYKKKKKEIFSFLANASKKEFTEMLDGNGQIPLLEERYKIVIDVSKVVCTKMNGSFYNFIKDITTDTELFNLINSNFKSFKDIRTYNEKEIPFYKLAQILISDIFHIIEFMEGKNMDYSHLVGCADYKIPQVLRAYDITEYSETLSNLVDNNKLIDENSSYEVEIRASMIVVVDYIYEKLNGSMNRIDINDYIWNKSRDKDIVLKPYHLTRTTSY